MAESRPPSLLGVALVFYAVLLIVALAWRSAWYGEPLLYATAEDAARGVDWLWDGGVGLAAGLLLVALSRFWTRRSRAGAALARELSRLLGPIGPLQALGLALLSGIAEEAFFRGALQPPVGLVVASLIFGLAHLAPRREMLAWAPATVVAGFALGGLFHWTGNLLAPVLAHVVVNALNLSWLGREGEEGF